MSRIRASRDPLELLQEEVVHGDDRVGDGTVQCLVADVEELPALCAEAAAERDPVWLGGRRRVERPGGRRLPVDDDWLPTLVVHPAAADVRRVGDRLEIDPSEAQALLRVLERLQATCVPRVERLAGDLVDHGVTRVQERLAHAVEAVVRVVEIRLLGGDVGVRHDA